MIKMSIHPLSRLMQPRSIPRRVASSITMCAMVIGLLDVANGNAVGSPTIADLIERVRTEEARYEDCEAHLRVKYRLRRAPVIFTDEGAHEVTERDSQNRYVLQDGMFRVEEQGERRDTSGTSFRPEAHVRLFDGMTCRAFKETTMNIIDGPTLDDGIIRPHMMVVQAMTFPVPLSTFLGGSAALEAYPAEVTRAARRHIQTTYLGKESIEGHPCHQVEVRCFLKGKDEVTDIYRIWLAEDRNYIPIHCESYAHKWSTAKQIGIGTVSVFREVAPNVWCPSKASVLAYDGVVLQSTGKQVPAWEKNYELESFSLNPAYPVEYFKELSVPDGTAIYHVDSSGNIVESYVKGALRPGVGGRRSWLLWANLGVLLVLFILIAWARLRRRGRLKSA